MKKTAKLFCGRPKTLQNSQAAGWFPARPHDRDFFGRKDIFRPGFYLERIFHGSELHDGSHVEFR